MDRHLDDASLRALEARDPRTMAHFRDHLARPCAECEAYLADAPARLWWLEAEVDRLLHLHGALSTPTPDTSGFRAVRRAMRARRIRKTLAISLAGAVAVAAALVLTVAVPRSGGPGAGPLAEGVKGPESGLLELSAAVLSKGGATAPIATGARARPEDTLLLRYRADRAGPAYLVKSGPDGRPHAMVEVPLLAGTHDLSDSGGGLAGVSLEGDEGEVRLWLVQSQGPLSASAAEEAVEGVLHRSPVPGVRVVGFTVNVGPGEH